MMARLARPEVAEEDGGDAISSELSKRFKVRLFEFNKEARRFEATAELRFNGPRTRIEAPTDLLAQEMGTLPLTGVVADHRWRRQRFAAIERNHWLGCRNAKIPFYTVGVGSEEITRDAEVIKVTAPREMLKDSTAVVDVQFKSSGLSGRKGRYRCARKRYIHQDPGRDAAAGQPGGRGLD